MGWASSFEEFMSPSILLFDRGDADALQWSPFLINRAHSAGIWELCRDLWSSPHILSGRCVWQC